MTNEDKDKDWHLIYYIPGEQMAHILCETAAPDSPRATQAASRVTCHLCRTHPHWMLHFLNRTDL